MGKRLTIKMAELLADRTGCDAILVFGFRRDEEGNVVCESASYGETKRICAAAGKLLDQEHARFVNEGQKNLPLMGLVHEIEVQK